MKELVNNETKTTEIWLTNADQNDSTLTASLKPLYKKWKDAGYRCVVFCSGHRDLLDLTEGLLLHNRTVAAHRDWERIAPESKSVVGMTMSI